MLTFSYCIRMSRLEFSVIIIISLRALRQVGRVGNGAKLSRIFLRAFFSPEVNRANGNGNEMSCDRIARRLTIVINDPWP